MAKRKNKMVTEEYWDDVEVTDPKTGKLIKQKVKITRYKMLANTDETNKGVLEELEDYGYAGDKAEESDD